LDCCEGGGGAEGGASSCFGDENWVMRLRIQLRMDMDMVKERRNRYLGHTSIIMVDR
jgi:hypothetical protein